MMRLTSLSALALASLAPAVPTLAAQEPPAAPAAKTPLELRADAVVALLNGRAEPEDLFTAGFRAAVPDAQLKALSASLVAQVGRAVEVTLLEPRDGLRAAIVVRFERGIAKGTIGIDPAEENRVNLLHFQQVEPLAVAGDTPERIAADLAALPGTVNAWFGPLHGGEPVIAVAADRPLALGSAFKLYVLAALAEDVKAGRRQWTDVVPLSEKSFPSGQLQNWPKGSPVTLHTLAGLMISISDNTATDQLIAVLGRKRILKLMKDSGHADPGANDPFLTTRELFLIKASDDATLGRWREGGAGAREQVAAAAGAAGTETGLERITAAFAGGPRALEVEWFASPADLAGLLAHMRRTADPQAFAIMAINPSANGTSIREAWPYIGFKGGSEPGVLNLTWLLTDRAGRDWVLTLGWNDPAATLDNSRLEAIAQRILLLPR